MVFQAEERLKDSVLSQQLQAVLQLNKARANFLSLYLVSLLKVKSVNSTLIAQGMETAVQWSSNVRRIEHFFEDGVLSGDRVAQLLMNLLPLDGPYAVSLDRTTWQVGRQKVNVLVLAVAYRGMALPLLWSMLDNKGGNSHQNDRIALFERFEWLFGLGKVSCVYADREFIGGAWWRYLLDKGIDFCIRIRNNQQIERQGVKIKAASDLFKHLKVGKSQFQCRKRFIQGVPLYLTGSKIVNEQGKIDYIIVACSQPWPDAMSHYGKRWQIETMFKAFKTNGLNLEDTHIQHLERLDQLLMMVSITFVWAYRAGLEQHRKKPIKNKKHGYAAFSWFMNGLIFLGSIFLNYFKQRAEAYHLFLSGT